MLFLYIVVVDVNFNLLSAVGTYCDNKDIQVCREGIKIIIYDSERKIATCLP